MESDGKKNLNGYNEDEDLVYVGMCGKQVEIIKEIPIISEDVTTQTIEVFKDALMITIASLNKTIDFLQGELEEKNLLVRTLMLRNANNGELLEESFVNSFLNSKQSQSVETTSSFTHTNYSALSNSTNNYSMHDENLLPEGVISDDNAISSSCDDSFTTIDNLTSSTEYQYLHHLMIQ